MARKKSPSQNEDLRAQSTLGIDLDCLPTLLGFNIRRAQIALWRDFNRNVAEGYVRPSVPGVQLPAAVAQKLPPAPQVKPLDVKAAAAKKSEIDQGWAAATGTR